jgi:uncharacterized membrane protein
MMPFNLGLATSAPLAVQIHLLTVLPAFAIGTWLIFFSTKGALLHRRLGVVYLTLMTITAFTTLFIHEIRPGQLSLVHLFIPLTLFGVFGAIFNLRRGNIIGHRNAMIGLYVGGLLIAGAFTFTPGRLMHRIFFG